MGTTWLEKIEYLVVNSDINEVLRNNVHDGKISEFKHLGTIIIITIITQRGIEERENKNTTSSKVGLNVIWIL